MNTAPLQNPVSILPGPPATARANDAGTPQTPFNQLLSNEVAQRREAAGADSKAAGGKPADGGQAPAGAGNDARDGAPAEPAATDGAASIVAVPAELLALVAGLQHGAGALPAADGGAAGGTAGDADQAEAALAIEVGTPRAGSKPAAAVELAGAKAQAPADGKVEPAPSGKEVATAAGTARDAAAQPTAFAAAGKQAGAAATAPEPNLLNKLEAAAAPVAAPAAPAAALAPGALQTVQGMTPHPAERLTPQVGTPAWDAALGQKVVWMAAGGQHSAALTLNPPDLGPLQVVLHVNNAHASATFISAQPEVRQALEAAMPRLREMMSDAGIQLGQANVSTGSPDQQQAQGQPAPGAARGTGPAGASGATADAALPAARGRAIAGGRGLVDTFA